MTPKKTPEVIAPESAPDAVAPEDAPEIIAPEVTPDETTLGQEEEAHSGKAVVIWVVAIVGMCGVLLCFSLFAAEKKDEKGHKKR